MKKGENAWSGKSRGGSFGHRFFVFLVRRAGIRAAYAFLSLVVIYFIPFAPRPTSAVWRYNRRILGHGRMKSAVGIYAHYYIFGQTIIDKMAIANGLEHKFRFVYEHYDQFIKQLDSGPAIIIGAHVGCWEVGSQFFGEYARRLNLVMFDGEYQKIKEAVQSHRAGYKIIPVNEGGVGSLVRIKLAIDSGEYVCFQGDRYMGRSAVFRTPFMGSSASFPQGPFLLASKFAAPVIFYFAMREKGMRYRFIFRTMAPGRKPEEILKVYTAELEKVVRAYPRQWFNFYDVWAQG